MPAYCFTVVAMAISLALVSAPGPAAAAQNETIFSFAGQDGRLPAGITTDAVGVIYGTTTAGGTSKNCHYGCGTVFRLLPPTGPGVPWKHEVLYSFQGQADGGHPSAAPVIDTIGNIYGTTAAGGSEPVGHDPVGGGVVWQLSPDGSGGWSYHVLHTFAITGGDGYICQAGLLLGPNGVLYGATVSGGAIGYGTLYSLTSPTESGQPWIENILYSEKRGAGLFHTTPVFSGHDTELVGIASGINPSALYDLRLDRSPAHFGRRATLPPEASSGDPGSGSPTISKDHAVYYPAPNGNTVNVNGSIEVVAPPTSPGGSATVSSIYTFSGTDGANPTSTLLRTASGSLLGTTSGGSTFAGTVFRLDPPTQGASSWTLKTLHEFSGSAGSGTSRPDGAGPIGNLVWGYRHRLYGVTEFGGRHDRGTVFWQSPS